MNGTDLLRRAKLRVTRPRLAVLEVLRDAGGHLDVDEIASRVRARLDSVSTQAIYDVLGALSRAGLARRIEPAGSPALYEARAGDNHHHVVCRGCGVIADIDCTVGQAPCLEPANTRGFEVDEAEVTFWGLCPACQSRRTAEAELLAAGAVRPRPGSDQPVLPVAKVGHHPDRAAQRPYVGA